MNWYSNHLKVSPRRRFRPQVEALEDRRLLSIGTYVEDFVADDNPAQVGFDRMDKDPAAPADELLISNNLPAPNFSSPDFMVGDCHEGSISSWAVQTVLDPAPGASPYALYLFSSGSPGDENCEVIFRFSGYSGAEQVADVAVTVQGQGSIVFRGRKGREVTLPIDTAPGVWQLIVVTRDHPDDDSGATLGGIKKVRVTGDVGGHLFIDDLTVRVAERSSSSDNVTVRAFGNYLGIIGDDDDNHIVIELLNSRTGEVRVTGRDGTTVNGVAEAIVYVIGTEDAEGNPDPNYRPPDVYVTMNGGDDDVEFFLLLPFPVEDMLIDLGRGDNNVSLGNIDAGDLLAVHAGSGDDKFTITDAEVGKLELVSRAGNDTIELSDVDSHGNWGFAESDLVQTGRGDDTVTVDGFEFQKDVEFDLGAGRDELYLRLPFVGIGASFRGGLELQLGGGDDLVAMIGCDLYAEFDVHLGLGLDSINVSQLNFYWAYSYSLGVYPFSFGIDGGPLPPSSFLDVLDFFGEDIPRLNISLGSVDDVGNFIVREEHPFAMNNNDDWLALKEFFDLIQIPALLRNLRYQFDP